MKTIYIERVKSEAMHSDLVQAFAYLKLARTIVNKTAFGEGMEDFENQKKELAEISDQLCTLGSDLMNVIGDMIFLRAENEMDKIIACENLSK